MSKRLKSKAKTKRAGRKRALRQLGDTKYDTIRAGRRNYGQGAA